MRRESLAECQPGDWVAMMDAEELEVGIHTPPQEWTSPDGETWRFRFKEMPVEGGTLFGWVRE